DLVDRFRRAMETRDGRLFVMYGQNEATARIAYVPPERLADKIGAVGIAIPGGRLCVVDGEREHTAPGVAGEGVYERPNVMMATAGEPGDLQHDDELARRLPAAGLGRFDADGYLFLTGRTKRFAKIFGLRVNLDEIEAAVHGVGPVAAVSDDEKIVVWC